MEQCHLHGFIDGLLKKRNFQAMLPHMADDMVLHTPLAAEPAVGKEAIRRIVTGLLNVVDAFEVRELLQGPRQSAVAFGVTIGPAHIDGVDLIRLAPDGRVQEMRVHWRPLPAVVQALDIINRAAGRDGVELVSGG